MDLQLHASHHPIPNVLWTSYVLINAYSFQTQCEDGLGYSACLCCPLGSCHARSNLCSASMLILTDVVHVRKPPHGRRFI
ncbi:hypothetical protein V6N13_134851 [Hibiscus sabdariffa]